MFNKDENLVICAKGKIYETIPSTEFELTSGICFWIKTEINESVPLTLKLFDRYFTTITEMRNMKINEILK
jgi:hypothetical protein